MAGSRAALTPFSSRAVWPAEPNPSSVAPASGNALLGPAGTNPTIVIAPESNGTSTTFFDSGTLTFGADNAITGGLTVINGTMQSTAPVVLPNGIDLGSGQTGSSDLTIGATSQSIVITGGVTLNGLTATVTVNSAAQTLIAGVIANNPLASTATTLITQGTGTLTLTGANTYTGQTLINSGTLNAQNGATPVTAFLNTQNFNIQNYSALGATANAVQTLTFASGTTGGTFTLTVNGTATTGPIAYSTNVSVLVQNVQNALNALVGAGNTMVINNVINTAPVNAPAGLTITFLNNLGSQNVSLTAAASLTGTGASVSIAATTVGSGGAVVVASGASLQLQGGTQGGYSLGGQQSIGITIANQITLAGGTLQTINGNNNVTGQITLASASSIGGGVGYLNIAGDIVGPGDLNKFGQGNVVLSSNNYYTGETNVNGGMLLLGDQETLPGATAGSDTYLGSNVGGAVVASGATLWISTEAGDFDGKALTLNGNGLGSVPGRCGDQCHWGTAQHRQCSVDRRHLAAEQYRHRHH